MVCLGRSDIPFQSERIEPYIQTKHSARTPRTMLQRYIRMLHMLQWFVHVSCKRLFSMFHLFFRRMLFIWMLHMFHTYVAIVLFGCCVCVAMGFKCFSRVFRVSYACFKCFIYLLLYVGSIANVSKVDQGLHMGCM